MLSKSIKYTDYNGVEREEKFLFNLSKAELMEMEMGTAGGLAESIRHIIETQDGGLIMKTFKDLILKAYGEKSADGKRFIKVNDAGVPLSVAFSQTEAYSELFMELATDSMAAAKFVEGIVPNDIDLSNVELPDDLKTPEMEAALNQMKQDKVIPMPTDK
jgi:hypothetical protein|nr:MAG TPA: hypothetical protein [Caudoviricetes sp.]